MAVNDVYMFNALGTGFKNEPEDGKAYFFSRLINVRNMFLLEPDKKKDFAKNLLGVVKNYPALSEVSRLCVAISLPLSNRLQVLSSASTFSDNIMQRGYSCYVSPASSLMAVNRGGLRTFNNIDDIFNTYIESGKPIQRSINYIKKMNIKSGISIRLSFGNFIGYLFLNSDQKNYFSREKLRDLSSYLNLLEMVCCEYFADEVNKAYSCKRFQHYIENFPRNCIQSNAHLGPEGSFSQLTTYMASFLKLGDIQLNISNKVSGNFLIPWEQISLLITFLLEEVHFKDRSINLGIDKSDENVILTFGVDNLKQKISIFQSEQYKQIGDFAENLGMKLANLGDSFLIKLPIDPFEDQDSLYSIAEEA